LSDIKSKIHSCREKLAISIEMLEAGNSGRVIDILREISDTLNDIYPEVDEFKREINRIVNNL